MGSRTNPFAAARSTSKTTSIAGTSRTLADDVVVAEAAHVIMLEDAAAVAVPACSSNDAVDDTRSIAEAD